MTGNKRLTRMFPGEWRRYARNRVGSWQQAQIEWRSGPIDGMRVHPKLGRTGQIDQHRDTRPPVGRMGHATPNGRLRVGGQERANMTTRFPAGPLQPRVR